MKPTRWACCKVWLALLLALSALSTAASATPDQPSQAWVLFADSIEPPPAGAAWQPIQLPTATPAPVAWFRLAFDLDQTPADAWSLYLPYFYNGGRLVLNGQPLARIRESGPDDLVRWERPHLVPIPPAVLRPGRNELLLRVAATPRASLRLPVPTLGPTFELLGHYENRLFWVRTMSQLTVAACTVVGLLGLFIWWRRPEEALYGLFGASALLWGLRTLTFVVEVLPPASWHAWRTLYHAATGGFAITMLLFAMQLAGMHAGRLRWFLLGYWALGPLGYIASGGNELLISTVWAGGLLPIGLALLVIAVMAAWRQRTPQLIVLSAALGVAVLAGFHDYLLASATPVMQALAPRWAAHRIFLLHYAADLLLVAMGVVLAVRLVGTLQAIEQLNCTLEARVAESERAMAANYERLRRLERQHAAIQERQQIMRDLHDGLGSQLFVALSRAEGGRISSAELVQALRDCIADMRLTLEAMSPDGNDFLEAWGNFRFRWQQVLDGCGVASDWKLESEDERVEIGAHVTLQLLRIVQEALTNVLKHAGADRVEIGLRARREAIRIEIADNGRGLPDGDAAAGHGLANMRARAHRVGARLQVADRHPGVQVCVDLPQRQAAVA
ncbi:sensor histidine kinase [Ramlibacter sp.]|uniref:sensor histidine kinase n=1 Tax=Ramlibacter sp. TaxID=1917967 RepID=UPI002C92BFE2|nr:ATP-binding protein [Ramlibacter sp.]HWI84370.1 ATP-binding protein [Ramlibacter sp.]